MKKTNIVLGVVGLLTIPLAVYGASEAMVEFDILSAERAYNHNNRQAAMIREEIEYKKGMLIEVEEASTRSFCYLAELKERHGRAIQNLKKYETVCLGK